MLKVGVIGYGYSAKTFHIPLIETSESFELVALSSSQKEMLKSKFPQISTFKTANDLITSTNLDLIVITAPNDVHYQLAKQCLENGINVVLEKPMVTTTLEAKELVDIAKERSLILSVFHNRRWDGDFLTVKKLIKSNLIGDVRFFESHYDRFRPKVKKRWREKPGKGTGIWFDLGTHLVDQAINIFGLPEAITARCLPLRTNSQTTDYFHVLLHYNNLEVILHASSFSATPNNRFRVEGTKGSFVKYGYDPQEEQLKSGVTPEDSLYGVEMPEHYGHFYSDSSNEPIETENGCYHRYYSKVAEAIKSGSENPINPVEVIEVLNILELAERSNIKGKTLLMSKFEN